MPATPGGSSTSSEPLPDAASASNANETFGTDSKTYAGDLSWFCPKEPKAGSDLCGSGPEPDFWYASSSAFHRYLLISISMFTDGKKHGGDKAKNAAEDCIEHVADSI